MAALPPCAPADHRGELPRSPPASPDPATEPATEPVDRGAPVTSFDRVVARPRDRFRDWRMRLRRRVVESDGPALAFLALLTVALVIGHIWDSTVFPQTAVLLPIFLASLWLSPRTLPWFVIFA